MPQGLRAAITSKVPFAMTALCVGELVNSDNYQKLAEGKPLVGQSAPLFSSKRHGANIDVSVYFPSYKVSLETAIWEKLLSHDFDMRHVTSCLFLNSP